MDVIGHRGGAGLGPENTLGSIRAALAAGADGVEIDVRLSADGVAILMHDADVARTTGAAGLVAELNADVMRSLGVPTLEETLAAVPADRLLVVEVKGTPWEPGHDPTEALGRVVAELLAGHPDRRIVVSSFNPMTLVAVRAVAPGLRTAVLTSPSFDPASNLAAAIEGSNDECHVPEELVESVFVKLAHEAGKRVVAWTVNEPDRLRALASWGIDGVITDDPSTALAALGR